MKIDRLSFRRPGFRIAGFAVMTLISACTFQDLDHQQSHEDYKVLTNRKMPESKPAEAPPIPDLQPILAAPPPPGVGQRLVSVTVTDPEIPVRDVLLELARKVGADIDL